MSQAFGRGSKPLSDNEWLKTLQLNKNMQAGLTAMGTSTGLSDADLTRLMQAVVRMNPFIMRADSIANAAKHSNGAIKIPNIDPEYLRYQDRLPAIYQNLETNPQIQSLTGKQKTAYSGNLTKQAYELVRSVAAQNAAFEQALQMAGLATRSTSNGQAGALHMPSKPISTLQLARALGHLHKDVMIPALEGEPQWYRSIVSADPDDVRRIANSNNRSVRDSISAMEQLAVLGIQPVYTRAKPRLETPGSFNVVANSQIVSNPNRYQIMSLTWDDFKKGRILNPNGEAQSEYEERPRGVSINKMIQESGFTRLLGMYGNNTLGNGSKTDYGRPKMLQIDFSKQMFETDKNGHLIWENGQPRANEETHKIINQLMAKTKTIPGTSHQYAVTPFGNMGGYVPTNFKNGVVSLVPEDVYVAQTNASLK